jgi:ribonuclease D
MEELAGRYLGVTKSRKVGRWGVPTLSKKQVRYACVDAYLSYRQ